MQKKVALKISLKLIIILLLPLSMACKKSVDISGTYKKISGNYRYDTIIIKRTENKENPDEYWITTSHEGRKRFKTKNVLKERTIQLGFIAPIEFYPDFKKFYLKLAPGSIFEKEAMPK